MTDIEVEFEALVASDSPSGRGAFGVLQEDVREVEQPSFFAVVAPPAPPGGENAPCSCDCEACSCPGVRWMERSLQSIELQLRFLMSKADDLHNWLVDGPDHLEGEALAAAVPSFLYTCQPFFNLLESTSSVSQHTLLPFDIYTRRAQLLDFSQQLCDRLEQLVLTYASCNLLCLDETNPNSVSHFCIGCSQVGPLRVTAFRYCKPTAYLAQVDSGLYKRMRWNVVGPRDERRAGGAKIVCDTEYYFLCYEDIPNVHADAASVVRMWSIGLWQQVTPDTDDIDDWVLCRVPQANYHKLLFLGSEEPSSCSATEYLQQLLLLSRPAPE